MHFNWFLSCVTEVKIQKKYQKFRVFGSYIYYDQRARNEKRFFLSKNKKQKNFSTDFSGFFLVGTTYAHARTRARLHANSILRYVVSPKL